MGFGAGLGVGDGVGFGVGSIGFDSSVIPRPFATSTKK